MQKLSFSGHESFHCRSLWLNKGFHFISQGKKFSNEDAVVDLGVGKNMVNSINYWLNSFGFIQEKRELSEIAKFLFGKNGVDPYLEDIASLWLLHYHIITENKASIFNLFFNEFRKQQIEFTKNQLFGFLQRKCSEGGLVISPNTLKRDIPVFLRTYEQPIKSTKNLEEIYSGLFIELDLIEKIKKYSGDEHDWYKIENKERDNIPVEVLLYSILENPIYNNSLSISFEQLFYDYNSPGNIFVLTSKGLVDKIEEITKKFKGIIFTDDAGIRELQIIEKPNVWRELRKYYAK